MTNRVGGGASKLLLVRFQSHGDKLITCFEWGFIGREISFQAGQSQKNYSICARKICET